MKKILITGFSAFNGDEYNPSSALVERFPDSLHKDIIIVKAVLPVSYDGAQAELIRLIDKHSPFLVVCFGLAAGRSDVCIETQAVNIQNASIADNDGFVRQGNEIINNGKLFLRSDLPLDKCVRALRDKGHRCILSDDAGKFVCNSVYYRLLLKCDESEGNIKGVFIHIPCDEKLRAGKPADTYYMQLDEAQKCCTDAVEYLVSE